LLGEKKIQDEFGPWGESNLKLWSLSWGCWDHPPGNFTP